MNFVFNKLSFPCVLAVISSIGFFSDNPGIGWGFGLASFAAFFLALKLK